MGLAVVTAVLAGLEVAQVDEALRYERTAVADGEWWRLFSGHLVHLGFSHVLLNCAGLVLVMPLVGDRLRGREWLAVVLVTAPAISLGLWILAPRVDWYVGLSGLLHGLVAAGALVMLAQAGRARGRERCSDGLWAVGIVALLTLKLAWEQVHGPLPGSVESSGGPVVVDAHLFGALAGAAWATLRIFWIRCAGARSGAVR